LEEETGHLHKGGHHKHLDHNPNDPLLNNNNSLDLSLLLGLSHDLS